MHSSFVTSNLDGSKILLVLEDILYAFENDTKQLVCSWFGFSLSNGVLSTHATI